MRAELAAGKTVALIAAGDPLIYSSQQHLSRRLAGDYPVDIIPGISSFQAAAAATNSVLCEDHDVFVSYRQPCPSQNSLPNCAAAIRWQYSN
ncbi:MAG: SAM-dependent methyltransferase [Lawsonella clevelandensis]